jgi:hypothetical protein
VPLSCLKAEIQARYDAFQDAALTWHTRVTEYRAKRVEPHILKLLASAADMEAGAAFAYQAVIAYLDKQGADNAG